MAVAAAAVTRPLIITTVAAFEMTAESRGATHLDRGHDASLGRGERPIMLLTIGFAVAAEDVRHFQLRAIHRAWRLEPKLSDFFDCCSVFGQRGENQSGFGVTAGQKWFECAQRSERTTLGGTCCRSRPRSAEVVRHLSISTSVLIPVDDQSACERLAW